MAIKIEIIGNNLVISDTTDGSIKLERPAADVYALVENSDAFKIVTRTDRSDVLYTHDYTNLVDSTGGALSKASLITYFRNSLGALKQGGFTFIDPDLVPVMTSPQRAVATGFPVINQKNDLVDGNSKPFSTLIALLWVWNGQSNEKHNVLIAQKDAYPQAFKTIKKPGVTTPIRGTQSMNGGPSFKMLDDLYEAGINSECLNMARGSASIVKHYAGQCEYRNNNQAYYAVRDPAGNGDRGDIGSIVVVSGKVFQCTKGRARYIQYNGNRRIPGSVATVVDYVLEVGTQTSAAVLPAGFDTAVLGTVITDGTVEWTCIDPTNSIGYAGGQIFTETQRGLGFDPLGLLIDTFERSQAINAKQKMVLISNAQSDTGALQAWYRDALISIAGYYTSRDYKVLLGLSCYNSNNGIDRTAAYNTLTAAVEDALTSLSSNTLVFRGANNYLLMGTTGPMSWASAQAGTGYLQTDGTHLNAPGAIIYGGNWYSYLLNAYNNIH